MRRFTRSFAKGFTLTVAAQQPIRTKLEAARIALRKARRIAVLTGAGISKESGLPTFREPQTGLWSQYKPEDLANPHAFAVNPELIWAWYIWRLELCRHAVPNAGHFALSKLAAQVELTLLTQNVDGLHRRAGSAAVIELHGNLERGRCTACRNVQTLEEAVQNPPRCKCCGAMLRPDVVWFGEDLPQLAFETAHAAFMACDVALIVGTSGLVQPAAGLASVAKRAGATVIEINPLETTLTALVDYALRGSSCELLPALLE